ncbi:hypothetical protein NQ314_008871 [Rhamnusium bicolor]|uniref:Uncharacterized protein n=1 Tax=Rhamnusium bicolor TaxID=1586634 RepID=A0AAV8Y5V4_9CUCU|nr:hypothetical protein NQ314_008871 [Rhamnusium bicolor]
MADEFDRVYMSTIRGCQPLTTQGICSQLMKTVRSKTNVQKGVFCETCEEDLCNYSPHMKNICSQNLLMITLVIILKYFM